MFLAAKAIAFEGLKDGVDYTDRLPVVLTILRDRLYMLVRDAKILDFESAIEPNGNDVGGSLIPAHSEDSRIRWKRVTMLGRTMIDLCAFCPPSLLAMEMNTRVTVQTLHALALGRLGRFYQAHRRLNEAHALLTRAPAQVGETPDFALIELRRAEVYLLEADQVGALLKMADYKKGRRFGDLLEQEIKKTVGKRARLEIQQLWAQIRDIHDLSKLLAEYPPNYPPRFESGNAEGKVRPGKIHDPSRLAEKIRQILVAKLDDAWSSIETAEHLLSGQIRTSLSWGRLCNLKLRFFAHHTSDDIGGWDLLALHRRHDLSTELSRWLRLGFANWPDDPFRQMRLTWYFLRAKSNWAGGNGAAAREKSLPVGEKDDSDKLLKEDKGDIALICGMVDDWGRPNGEIKRLKKQRERFGALLDPEKKYEIFVNGLVADNEKGKLAKALGALKRPFTAKV